MIGAYYQCYRQRHALNFVLKKFRESYPNSSCILSCDGGEDYTKESEEFSCFYKHYQKLESDKKNLVFNTEKTCIEFILRLRENLHLIREDYFILLEDDVVVLKQINLESLQYDINGCNKNEFLSNEVQSLLKNYGFSPKNSQRFFYGAAGGSILKKTFFEKILRNEQSLIGDIKNYCTLSPTNLWASDAVLSFLCYKNGGTIGQYDGYAETWYPDIALRMNAGSVEVLHQFKNFYV
jgi:hypothetical protein